MSERITHGREKSATQRMVRSPRRSLPATMLGILLGTVTASQALAGGADVSTDEIYSDGVTLTTYDGLPLDIDDDGNMDLAVAANRGVFEERSRYYLGNGDGTFSTPGVLLRTGPSSDIKAANFDADFIDLVHGRRDLPDHFYAGDGAGGLDTGVEVEVADSLRTLSIAIGDLDLDGDLDLVTGNGRADGTGDPPQANRYYLNAFDTSGSATFTGADITADADNTRSIALADLDGDGDLDVIVGNDETTAASNRVYLNQFIESGSTAVSFGPGSDFGPADDLTTDVLVGDLDNDGQPDIVVVNAVSGVLSPGINRFFLNTTAGGVFSLDGGTNVSADTDRSNAGVLADFDGDGDLDLAVANFVANAPGQSSRNRLYLNQFIESGSVSFAAAIDISPDEHTTHSIAAADIDGDLDIDIIVGNEDTVAGVRDRRYLNNGRGPGNDPFENVVPIIDSQVALETPEETDLTIVLADVSVTDGDNVFPNDFTLTVQSGTNYTVAGNTITPATDFVGNLTVPVIVNDGTDDSPAFDLTVAVTAVNDAPTFTSVPVTDATQDAVYTYNVEAVDPDGPGLSITAPTLPAWLTLTDNGDGTATLTGTPGNDDVGDHAVSLEVSDGTASDTQDFTISVANVNDAPAFTSTAVTAATQDAAYTYDVTASDPDVGDTLTITAPTLPAWLTLTDNGGGTATLTGTPDNGDVGDHSVSLEVSDGTATGTQNFTVTVANVNDPPVFTSTAVTTAVADAVYTYDVTASDPDVGDTLTITAPTLPAWLTLTDNGDGTATLTGTPTAAEVGAHDVSLEVSDGAASDTQDFTITVGTGTGGNNTPVFTSTAVTDATAGTAYAYDVTASDADAGDVLAITGPTLPMWLTLTDNGDGTATLSGTPADGDVGGNDVVLEVSDGTDSSEQAFTITVVGGTSGNNAPSFTSTAVTGADEDQAYSYEVTATDPDTGDTLEITAPTLPSWLTLTDNGDGTATLAGTPAAAQVGDHAVSLQVSDGTDTAVQDFTITVTAAPAPPPPPPSSSGGGGGSAGLVSVLGLLAMAAFRRRRLAGWA